MLRSWLNGQPKFLAALIFLLAALIRIAFIYFAIGFHRGATEATNLNGDERDYLARAEHLLAGDGLTAGGAHDRMWRTPGYPLFLAATVALSGAKQLAAVRLLQALLGALTCVLLYFIARRVLADQACEPTAALAAGWFACYPPHAYMAGQILSENLLLPALLAAVLVFMQMLAAPRPRRALSCGLLFGVAAMIKPETGAIIGLAAACALWLLRGSWRERLQSSALVLVAALLLVAPWASRNYRLSGHLVISSLGGEAFWGGNNEAVLNTPSLRGYWLPPAQAPATLNQVLAAPTEFEQDRTWWRLGSEFLRAHQSDIPRLMAYKLRRFYSVLVQDRRERVALLLSFGWLLPFIAVGMAVSLRRFAGERAAGLFVLAIIGYYNLLAVVFWGANRLRLVIDPFLIMFGVWALCVGGQYLLRARRVTRASRAAS